VFFAYLELIFFGFICSQCLPENKIIPLNYGVERAYLLGYAAKGTMQDNSNVDFIIKSPEKLN